MDKVDIDFNQLSDAEVNFLYNYVLESEYIAGSTCYLTRTGVANESKYFNGYYQDYAYSCVFDFTYTCSYNPASSGIVAGGGTVPCSYWVGTSTAQYDP